MKEENLRSAFQLFDKDGDGKITAAEIRIILGANPKLSSKPIEYWEDLINDNDQDGDGELDFEEFMQMMKDEDEI